MNTIRLALCFALPCVLSSCMKEYRCVCTQTSTGQLEYGDTFKSGPVRKPAFEETCKNTEVLSAGTLKDCHLE